MGPATSSVEKIRELVDAGLDVARLNFSHGTHDDHAQMFGCVREVAAETGKAVGILADLQGPKIRLGVFGDGPVVWDTGETVRITVDDVVGNHDRVGTTYAQLARDAQVGDRLLVDDGKVGLVVTGIEGNVLHVLGLDILDHTPVLDIKPYLPYADAFPGAQVGWLEGRVQTEADHYDP